MSKMIEKYKCGSTLELEYGDHFNEMYSAWVYRHDHKPQLTGERAEMEQRVVELAGDKELTLRDIADSVGLNHPQSVKHILDKYHVERNVYEPVITTTKED